MIRRILYALWLLMTIALYVFENNTGTRAVLLLSVLLPALSILLAVLSARRMTCSLSAPMACSHGGDVTVTWQVTGRLPLTAAQVRVSAQNLLTGEATQLVCPATDGSVQLTAMHAGQILLRAAVCVQDVFGLYSSRTCAAADAQTLVQARRYDVQLQISGQGSGGDGAAYALHRAIDWMDSVSVREYQPGDPVRSIHWKLSQKADKLLVREAEAQAAGEWLLVLNVAGADDDPAQLDALVGLFLSVSAAAQAQDRPHTAVWQTMSGGMTCRVITADDAARMEQSLLSAGLSRQSAPILPHSARGLLVIGQAIPGASRCISPTSAVGESIIIEM